MWLDAKSQVANLEANSEESLIGLAGYTDDCGTDEEGSFASRVSGFESLGLHESRRCLKMGGPD